MTDSEMKKIIDTTSSFKILADPTRFTILCLLIKSRDGLCVNEIAGAADISQSAASHQLAKLEANKVAKAFREGQKMCYRLESSPFTRNLIEVTKIFHKK